MSDLSRVRLQIGGDATTSYVTDSEINDYLGSYGVDKTTAILLRALAANQAFLAGQVRTLGFSSSNEAAKHLKDLAAIYDGEGAAPAGGAAEIAYTPELAEEIIRNRLLRTGG